MGENQTTRKSVVRAQRHAEVAKIMEQAGCKTCGTYGTTASSKCQLSVVAIGRMMCHPGHGRGQGYQDPGQGTQAVQCLAFGS